MKFNMAIEYALPYISKKKLEFLKTFTHDVKDQNNFFGFFLKKVGTFPKGVVEYKGIFGPFVLP